MKPWIFIAWLIFMALSLVSWIIWRKQKEELDEQISIGQLNVGLTTDDASVATVCVYRLPSFVGSRNDHFIYCDGAPIADLKNGSYAFCRVAAGQHIFSSSGAVSQVPLTVEGGQEYFIRSGINGIKGFMEAVPKEPAQVEMKPLKQAS